MRRTAAALLLALTPCFGLADTPASPEIMQDVKSGNFSAATDLAESTGDPLVVKLVDFFRLTNPGGASADEIQQFIAQNPDWPMQGLLALRERQASGLVYPNSPAITPPFLSQIEAMHEAGQDDDAAALWLSQGASAMAAADDAQQLMFWPDENMLARALLAEGDAKNAYAVIAAVAPPADGHEQALDRDFLAGFLLLRFLNQPQQAAGWFHRLADASPAVITQGRAWYWLGRSESGAAAEADYARAAQYIDTYYGQLAAFALGDTPEQVAARVLAAGEPTFSATDALNFALMELPRAAVLLLQMGDTHDAMLFLNRLGQVAIDDRNRELAAKLALALQLPQSAVSISRSAGIKGQMLVREGWPMPVDPPDTLVEKPVSFAIMRQESSFDPSVVSGSGAMGLMQLMPATARMTARKYGLAADDPFDPDENMALGTTYLAGLIQHFGECLPLAFAAYNGGPGNVAKWLALYGDPELGSHPGGANLIDWVEEIPFNETRNYVQRVSESVTIYRAFVTGKAKSPVIRWLPGQNAAD